MRVSDVSVHTDRAVSVQVRPAPGAYFHGESATGLDVAAREQFIETVDHLHRSQPELATVLVTHHLEELPETTAHAALLKRGSILAAGDARDVLTTELVSESFEYPIQIEYRDQRWQARAVRTS